MIKVAASVLFIGMMVACLLVVIPISARNAYGHGIGPIFFAPLIRIDNEQFSNQTSDTDGSFEILGTLKNRADFPVKLSPYVYVSGDYDIVNSLLLEAQYPMAKQEDGMYFKIAYNLTNPVILRPHESLGYQITLYPLKAGTYHVHSLFISDVHQFIGPGQTVVVTGSTAPTLGEFTQLYLPLVIGVGVLVFLVTKALSLAKKKQIRMNRVEKGIRIYFALKCSLEVMWLSAILFWFALAAYSSYLFPFESRLGLVLAMAAAIAAITFGSCMASIARPKRLHVGFSVGTSVASALFYLVPLFANISSLQPQFDISRFLLFGTYIPAIGSLVNAIPSWLGFLSAFLVFFTSVNLISINSAVAIYIILSELRRRQRRKDSGKSVSPVTFSE